MSHVSYELCEGTAVSDAREVTNCRRELLYRVKEKLATVGGTAVSDARYELWEGTDVSGVRELINCGKKLLCRMQEKL